MKITKKRISIAVLIALVIVVNTTIMSLAKEKDKVEDKLVNTYNKEFEKEKNLDKAKEFKKAVKISKRIQVKTINQLDETFSLVDSKEKLEVVFILDEEDNAVGISIVSDGEILTIAETESIELLKLYNSLSDIYENEKKIKIYALPTFAAFSLVVEKSDGDFDVWPCHEMCTSFIKNTNLQPYQKYSLEEFFNFLTEQKIINDSISEKNNGEIVY